MPTERFLKLKEDKKKRILDAAFREFSRMPFQEASINRIIKDAEISRGSFYTYFEDKTDVLQMILASGGSLLTEHLHQELDLCGGDYFKALEGTFQWFREKLGAEDNLAVRFLRNTMSHEELFRNATGMAGLESTDNPENHPFYQKYMEFCEKTCGKLDRKHYPVTPEQMASLFPMTVMVIVKTAAECVEYPKAEPALKKQLAVMLDIMKNGVFRGQEQPEN